MPAIPGSVAIDADTKLVITWLVGPRDLGSAHPFISDLADRIRYRPQITSDGLGCYVSAVEDVFGADADFAQIIKLYGKGDDNETTAARYSPPTGSPAEAGTGAEVISERITDSVKFRRAWMRRHGLEVTPVPDREGDRRVNGADAAERSLDRWARPPSHVRANLWDPCRIWLGQGINRLPATRCA